MIRDLKVMVDRDLAILYGVTTGNLNKAVNRNSKRFPEDFMFELNKEEFKSLNAQIEVSNWGGNRKLPKVFTEQGVAMLSGVIHSDRAIIVNIQIMRTYTLMRKLLLTHNDILLKIEEMEKKVFSQDEKIKLIFNYLKQFIKEKESPRRAIGFKQKL